ncbi:hypothetical protein Peur_015924 [Populus x canadensis]
MDANPRWGSHKKLLSSTGHSKTKPTNPRKQMWWAHVLVFNFNTRTQQGCIDRFLPVCTSTTVATSLQGHIRSSSKHKALKQ